MGFMQRVFGASRSAPSPSPATPSVRPPQSRSAVSSQDGGNAQTVRKELARVAARDTFLHHGVPMDWIRVEPLTMAARHRENGVHVRLCVLHWDARLMQHAVGLQQQVIRRIQALDPGSDGWLMGLSWQFELADDSACPPLPPARSWAGADEATAVVSADPAPQADGQADVITGPTRIGGSAPGTREQLDRMLAERDAEFQSREGDAGFQKTEPMKL